MARATARHILVPTEEKCNELKAAIDYTRKSSD